MITLNFSKRYLFIPAVLTVFVLLFYLIYDDIKDRTVEEFNREQLILAETASQGIVSFFNDYQADLTFLSQFKDIIDFTDNSKAVMSSFYDNHKNLIEAVTRVDAHGIILFTYPNNETVIGNDISYQKHVRQVILTHQPVLSDVFMSVQGSLAIAMHVPVFKGDKFAGSLAMLIPIDKLGKLFLGKIRIRGAGKVWLLSENGIEIYCPVREHAGKSFLDNTHKAATAIELIERIKKDNHGTVKSVHQEADVDGKTGFPEKYMVFYRVPLKNTYWTILISYQKQDIFSALTRLRNRLILVFSLLFITVIYYFHSLVKVRNLLKEEAKRKTAERTLQESEEKFRTIFDKSPIGIELYRADGMLANANKASLNMFGIPNVSELQEFNLFAGTSLDAEKKDRLRKGLPVAYQSIFDFEKVKELHQYETHRTGKAYFDYIITPLFNPGGKTIDGYLVQIQDISERKRAEEEILMLAHSLRSINECVSITDTENKILFVNEAFSKTYGYSADELLGKNISMVSSTDNPSGLVDEILPATVNGGWKGELKNTRKDGSKFSIYLSTTIIKDKNGKPIGLIGVASDITERQRNEKELFKAKEKAEESDRLKSAFLANMSHEIRTPMNGILGFAGLLKEPGLTGEQQQEYIGIIEKSGARMLNIINDIVSISKIESGQMEISISETKVNEPIEFIYNFFKHEVHRKGIQFVINKPVPAKEVIIKTDSEKIYAILTNLVKNAIKYTRAGSIEIGYKQKDNFVEFFVKDTGDGIPPDKKEIIFERFRQGNELLTSNYEGAGLGLSISKSYVEMLGGKIWVDSEMGKGSAFYFIIPCNPDLKENNLIKPVAPDHGDENLVKNLKILIAEDDENSELLIRMTVKLFGKEILSARNGNEAVEICRNNPDIDLILLDIKMPGMDGYTAAAQIRQFNKDVIIVAQTAYGLTGDREKAIEAGCNDYIPKPYTRAALIALVTRIFKSRKI